MITKSSTLKHIKFQADLLKKETGLKHTAALELISKQLGFNNWHHAKKQLSAEHSEQKNARLIFNQSHPFRFYMDYKDSNWDWGDIQKIHYQEDTDLENAVFAYGINAGLSEQEVIEYMDGYIFLRHKTHTPKTVNEAIKLIENDFFFPAYSIFLNNYEHYLAFDPSAPDTVIWQGISVLTLFDMEADF